MNIFYICICVICHSRLSALLCLELFEHTETHASPSVYQLVYAWLRVELYSIVAPAAVHDGSLSHTHKHTSAGFRVAEGGAVRHSGSCGRPRRRADQLMDTSWPGLPDLLGYNPDTRHPSPRCRLRPAQSGGYARSLTLFFSKRGVGGWVGGYLLDACVCARVCVRAAMCVAVGENSMVSLLTLLLLLYHTCSCCTSSVSIRPTAGVRLLDGARLLDLVFIKV